MKNKKYIWIVSLALLAVMLAVTIGAFRVVTIKLPDENTLVADCPYCLTTCKYKITYDPWTEKQHCVHYICSGCGMDMLGGCCAEKHDLTLSNCWKCGYPDEDPMWVWDMLEELE